MTVIVPSWLTEEDLSIIQWQNPGVDYERSQPVKTVATSRGWK